MCFFRKRFRQLIWLQAEALWRMQLQLEGFILTKNSEAIAEVTRQLDKARAEIVIRIDSLQEAVDRGDDITGPLGDLRKAAQALDDLVADEDEDTGLETNGPATPDELDVDGTPKDNVSEEEANVSTDGVHKGDETGKNTVQPEDDPDGLINAEQAVKRSRK